MGKIRIKTIGEEPLEEAEKKKAEIKREQKKLRETKSASGGPVKEALEVQPPEPTQSPQAEPSASNQQSVVDKKAKKAKFAKKARGRSSNYSAKVMEIDKNKAYSLPEALELLKKIQLSKFDETVELHINTTEAGISGQVKLPHG